jgi:acyl dehydratase/NADP-dependent 3-hydroxy acid dehydrogenase YdfG
MTRCLASRSFSLADQEAFAKLSSDFNPMHLDNGFARRTQVGAPVVHGIHTLAWAANAALGAFPSRISGISARFLQPLYLDETASVRLVNRTDERIDIDVVAADTVVATIRLSSKAAPVEVDAPRSTDIAREPSQQPADPAFEQLAAQTGMVTVADPGSSCPALVDAIGAAGVKALLATSQIVGMHCPGLHSLFAGLAMKFGVASERANGLAYAVGKVDPRFRSLQIDVWGYGANGRLDAFARPAPPVQASLADIAAGMSGQPFAGQTSLIIGGSRGLGEVTAKIIASGGGRPIITYRESRREAERLAADILAAGQHCDLLPYDALLPAAEQLKALPGIDCLYYFATPKIFQRKSALFEPDKLRSFLSFYADGFFDLCATLARDRSRKLAVFCPSSLAIDEPVNGTAEYAMAKAASEILSHHLNRFMPNIEILNRRLPRILTDQTATVGVARAANALDVMLPIIYEVQRIARPD